MAAANSHTICSPVLATAPRARTDLARIFAFPRVPLGNWPTPIERVTRARGPEVFVKRDDLCGHGRGGAKARKIEHLVGHLLAQGHDELIATAGNVTNLVFDLLPVLRRHELRSRLFILDDPPALLRDREAIFEGVRDSVTLLGTSRAGSLAAMLAAFTKSVLAGGRPFVALPGVSHPSGVIGNARGFIEMMTQQRAVGAPLPDTVFVTAATGTTVAGFLLAEHALRSAGWPPVRIVGVQVYPGAIAPWTLRLLRWTEHFLRLGEHVPRARIDVVSSELHGGFGHFPHRLATLCDRVANENGVRLDPIFGAKTWAAMEAHVARSPDPGTTLYWHCGYTPEWRVLGDAVRRGTAAS
jgi:1-aminocyclopropane-1-carboxylate deaminase/D-cysteine desulfhydrase-like pyridoxal-dependent ACC family enzyme